MEASQEIDKQYEDRKCDEWFRRLRKLGTKQMFIESEEVFRQHSKKMIGEYEYLQKLSLALIAWKYKCEELEGQLSFSCDLLNELAKDKQ